MEKRVNVAYMITPFGDGGADRQLLELLRRLDRNRYEPTLYLSDAGGLIVRELAELDVPVVDMGQRGSNETAPIRLVSELRRRGTRVIHSWLFTANTWGRIAGRLAGVPAIIASERGMELDRKKAYHWIDVALHPLSHRVVVNAQMLADHVQRTRFVPRHKIVVIPNGVSIARFEAVPSREDARRRLGLPLNVPIIGMTASFKPRKRWDMFLKTIEKVAVSRPVFALAVGDGSLRPDVERLASAMGLDRTVRFLGVRSDMPEVMAAMDVAVHTSDEEGLPNVVLEAMASHLPVVATDAGGTRELIVPGETGYVTQRGDVSALAKHVVRFLDEPDCAKRMGDAGYRRVKEHFTFDACVGQTQALYEELLATSDEPGRS